MWKGFREYFEYSKEAEYIVYYKLKEEYEKIINKRYKYLIIDQEDKFMVYKSCSQKDHSLFIEKYEFMNGQEAELYVQEEMKEIIENNQLLFIFGDEKGE